MKKTLVLCIWLLATQSGAVAQTLFHYRVNGSDAGTVAGGAVPNLAGSAGVAQGSLTLSTDIPSLGVPGGAGNRSLSNGGAGGVTAPGLRQLSNASIIAAGGFCYETWFKWAGGGNVNAIIDYAGTEKFRVPVGSGILDMNFDNGSGLRTFGAITIGQWYYAAAVFAHDGNPEAGGRINGTLTWYINGNTPSGSASVIKDDFGDSLNRTISVGMHPLGAGGDYFDGLIYEPRVTLGTLTAEELLYSSKPIIVNFTADPVSLPNGGLSDLSWSVGGADTLSINPPVGAVANPSGMVTVTPTVTTTYTLSATNTGGTSTAEVTIYVNEIPLDPVINEFMADNTGSPKDEDDESSDWIEIFNPNPYPIPLDGWSLSDDPLLINKWSFPANTEMEAFGYLVLFASSKNRIDPMGELHTNFGLSRTGEYLALLNPEDAVVQEFSPTFPAQFENKSYGRSENGATLGYFGNPTPGEINGIGVLGFVADTKFLPKRGFYESTFDVTITSATPGATIIYTTDSSTPSLTNGTQVPAADSETPPLAVISVSGTTTLRASAFLPGFQPTNTDTQTYVFLSDVVQQSSNGAAPVGWPSGTVNGQLFDYGMDPNIVNSPTWGPQLIDGLKQIPSISIVTDQSNLTDASTGIYTHATSDSDSWERASSVELLLPDNTPGFQVNAGIRIRGGFSRGGFNPKHSFRLFFRSEYGASKLKYPLFGDEGVDEFDKIDLRTAQNYAWSNDTGNNELHNSFIRDVFHRDTQRDMGQPYTRSRYYHLYLNGQYWGLYQTQERSESAYASSYFGGERETWDVIKPSGGATRAVDGTITAYNGLHSLATAGFSTNAAYYGVQGMNPDGSDNPAFERHLNVDNLIDYMITNIYCGNTDGPLNLSNSGPNNFYVIRNREPAARDAWRFFCHDSEHSMAASNHDVTINVTGIVGTGAVASQFNPRWLSQQLAQNPDYRRRFGDRVQMHFFNNGALSPAKAIERWNERAAQINFAIVGESARWGDQHNEPPLNKTTWETELDWMRNSFLSARASIVIAQLRSAGLFPNIDAPVFSQHGGVLPTGGSVSISSVSGAIYYTIDGTDPRLPGATLYSGPLMPGQQTELRAAVLDSAQWSALTVATFLVDTVPADASNLVVSEFSYRPAAPTLSEDPAGGLDRGDFEFVELLNISGDTIDLSGVSFASGITYSFPANTILEPSGRAVLVKNSAAFEARYGMSVEVTGEFSGSLSNDGEQIILSAANGDEIRNFTYNDVAPWPVAADGAGFSLVLNCPDANPDHNSAANWSSSAALNGTPGGDDSVGFVSWMSTNGIVDPMDDSDSDGLPALIEFAAGSNPGIASEIPYSHSMADINVGGVVNKYLIISFRRDLTSSGLSIVGEESSDLKDWSNDAVFLGEENNGDGTGTVRWRSFAPVEEIGVFLRLKIVSKNS